MKRSHARGLRAAAVVLALGTVAASTPFQAAAAPPAVPRFALFGWLSPPPDSLTEARMSEMAELGLNVVLPPQGETGDPVHNLRRLDLAARFGLQCLIFDDRFARAWRAGFLTPQGAALLDSAVATYRDHSGLLGYYLGDEPRPPWDTLRVAHQELRRRDPSHMTWNNLLGRMAFGSEAVWRAYIDSYLDSFPAVVVCDDHYEFRTHDDRHQFFVNASGLRDLADAHGLPFWAIVQLTTHNGYRDLTPGEIRWQVSQLLAYGTRGIGYFTYWTPHPDPMWNWGPAIIGPDGRRTERYDLLKTFHLRVKPCGEVLAGCRWTSTQATAPVPAGASAFVGDDWLAAAFGRVTVGRFVDGFGRPHLLVANRDSSSSQEILLMVRGATGVTRLDEPGGPVFIPLTNNDPVPPVVLNLPAGDFALLRLEGTEHAMEKLGPVLLLSGQPARGVARFDLMRVGAGATLRIFDASGRLLWETALAPGESRASWNGTADDGRRVPAGIYFARLQDNRGTATARAVWLGP